MILTVSLQWGYDTITANSRLLQQMYTIATTMHVTLVIKTSQQLIREENDLFRIISTAWFA